MEHKHHGKSSANFLDSDEILNELNLKGNEVFMDAGCGDGYISKKALEKYLPEGRVYAVDIYDVAINEMENFKNENNVENLFNIEADISKSIPGVEDNSIDVILMVNVFHGFKASDEMDKVIKELSRVITVHGSIAIIDFKPVQMQKGPPMEIRLSPNELEEIFAKHDFEKIYLNENLGEDLGDGAKCHYLIIFRRD